MSLFRNLFMLEVDFEAYSAAFVTCSALGTAVTIPVLLYAGWRLMGSKNFNQISGMQDSLKEHEEALEQAREKLGNKILYMYLIPKSYQKHRSGES